MLYTLTFNGGQRQFFVPYHDQWRDEASAHAEARRVYSQTLAPCKPLGYQITTSDGSRVCFNFARQQGRTERLAAVSLRLPPVDTFTTKYLFQFNNLEVMNNSYFHATTRKWLSNQGFKFDQYTQQWHKSPAHIPKEFRYKLPREPFIFMDLLIANGLTAADSRVRAGIYRWLKAMRFKCHYGSLWKRGELTAEDFQALRIAPPENKS